MEVSSPFMLMNSKKNSNAESTSPKYRASIASAWATIALLALTPGTQALEPAAGHVEIDPQYNPTTSTWHWATDWFDDDLNLRDDPVDTLFFPGHDAPPFAGIRNPRPGDERWDFLGVDPGETIWIYAANQLASPGFQTTPAHLTGNLAFTLLDVQGPDGGVFSMYTGTAPHIHFRAVDGDITHHTFEKPPQHTHVNWAFSKKGLWIVTLQVQGTLAASGQPTSASEPAPLIFAVGEYAQWKATHFDAVELADPTISGDHADPDGDGIPNLLEFALGGDPKSPSMNRPSDGRPLMPQLLRPTNPGQPWQLTFHRRIPSHRAEVTYQLESSPTLNGNDWIAVEGTESILEESGSWQHVAIALPEGTSPEQAHFFRLAVDLIP